MEAFCWLIHHPPAGPSPGWPILCFLYISKILEKKKSPAPPFSSSFVERCRRRRSPPAAAGAASMAVLRDITEVLEDEAKQCGKDDRAPVIEGDDKDATMEEVTSVEVEDGAPSLEADELYDWEDADEHDDWEDADEHDDWEDEEEDESSLEDALSFKGVLFPVPKKYQTKDLILISLMSFCPPPMRAYSS